MSGETDKDAKEPPHDPTVHQLKTWPEFFAAVWSGEKPFEVRRDDRVFQKGDALMLHEWSTVEGFLGRWIQARVTYVLRGGQFGIEPGFAVMGIEIERRHDGA